MTEHLTGIDQTKPVDLFLSSAVATAIGSGITSQHTLLFSVLTDKRKTNRDRHSVDEKLLINEKYLEPDILLNFKKRV